jgi:hypothetical protein
METTLTGVADVHTRPLLDGFEPLQNLDVVGAVRGAIG